MFSFADTPFLVKIAVFAVLAATLACFLGVVGLRFVRRGPARFWTVPASAALVLFPVVLGAGLTAMLFRQTLGTLALTGSGGRAALAGSSAEAILPLAFGLPAAALLALVALIAVAITRANTEGAETDGGAGLHAAALVAAALVAGLVVLVLGMVAAVNIGPGVTDSALMRLRMSLPGAVLLAAVLCVLGLGTVLRAPRTSAPAIVKLLSVSVLALSGLGALAGVWSVQGRMRCLLHTGLTGLPCGVDAPVPETSASPEEGTGLSAEASAPAPPAAPGTASGTAPGNVPDDGAPVRIGGAIPEPRKLESVNPVYPDIARQARVQGVVILVCTVGANGRIEHVKVLRGVPLLDEAAVDAVKQWVYTPTIVNGVPARVIMTVTVNFRLR
jgi:TonB family protein